MAEAVVHFCQMSNGFGRNNHCRSVTNIVQSFVKCGVGFACLFTKRFCRITNDCQLAAAYLGLLEKNCRILNFGSFVYLLLNPADSCDALARKLLSPYSCFRFLAQMTSYRIHTATYPFRIVLILIPPRKVALTITTSTACRRLAQCCQFNKDSCCQIGKFNGINNTPVVIFILKNIHDLFRKIVLVVFPSVVDNVRNSTGFLL